MFHQDITVQNPYRFGCDNIALVWYSGVIFFQDVVISYKRSFIMQYIVQNSSAVKSEESTRSY